MSLPSPFLSTMNPFMRAVSPTQKQSLTPSASGHLHHDLLVPHTSSDLDYTQGSSLESLLPPFFLAIHSLHSSQSHLFNVQTMSLAIALRIQSSLLAMTHMAMTGLPHWPCLLQSCPSSPLSTLTSWSAPPTSSTPLCLLFP